MNTMPPPTLSIGQVLRGRLSPYTVSKQIQDTVWFARNSKNNSFVVKSASGHPRVENERDVLERFQGRSPYIRPLVDEIQDPAKPTTIVLKHLQATLEQATLEQASITKNLNRKEIRYVLRRILEALSVLHEDGSVHTDVKPENVFVNYKEGKDENEDENEVRFSDVQLGDFGGTIPQDSKWAKSGTLLGTPHWCSPEVLMESPWNTATDIWSFGATVQCLILGGSSNPFIPFDSQSGDENYILRVPMQQLRYFGPCPSKIHEIVSVETLESIVHLMKVIPPENMGLFRFTNPQQVSREDNVFISSMMKMDWRDRPTAKELLQNPWFLHEKDSFTPPCAGSCDGHHNDEEDTSK